MPEEALTSFTVSGAYR